MSPFKDHFSGHAGAYARARPSYPPALYVWLAEQCRERKLAWDCATGNGQAAMGLAPHFTRVIATDASAEQIRNAAAHPQIEYRIAPAERSTLPDAGVDLIAVAQALHWFDLPRFFGEARRVLKPGGVLAAWGYGLNRISPAIDAIVKRFYMQTVGPYWPPERHLIDERYAGTPFPFSELETPGFEMCAEWTLQQYLDYLDTWSAVQRYRKARGADPLVALREELAAVWGESGRKRDILWPLFMRAGRM